MKRFVKRSLVSLVSVSTIFAIMLTGCGGSQVTEDKKPASSSSVNTSEQAKEKPDQQTEIKVGLPSYNASYLPFFVAEKKELFKKYNLGVTFTKVQGGVTALRGLQTGDFQIISSLPESVITGASEGANIKMIGTLDDRSMYSIYTTADIEKPEDLKGKVVATNRPGNGTDIQLRWWLKKHGLDPNEDVRIIEAGENSARLQTLITGQAKMTILSQPTDLKADSSGMKRLALMRDELKTYNHNMIIANNELLQEQPEVAKAFMAAEGEAVEFIKDSKNRSEVVEIVMEKLKMSKEEAEKSVDFVLPSLADKGKLNLEGVKWAIDTSKEAGALKKDITVDQLVDEKYYAQ